MNEEGKKYEDRACEYLKEAGFSLVERGYMTSVGEIDIIAYEGKTLVFIEVKGRASEKFGSPLEAINKSKRIKIIKTALCFIKRKNLRPEEIRFDAIGISRGGIEHIRDAFQNDRYYF